MILLQLPSSCSVWVHGSSLCRYRNTSGNKGNTRSRQGSGTPNAGFEMEDGHKPAGNVVNKLTFVVHFHDTVNRRYFNPFQASVPILYPLKTPKSLWFSGVFRGYKMGTLAWNGSTWVSSMASFYSVKTVKINFFKISFRASSKNTIQL